jgi:peroxiredoxin Q/BCP
MLKPGDAAVDFMLHDADGEEFRLSHFSGQPIVLYFYPKDSTPGCTLEAKGFRDHGPDFDAAGAIVVGVSLDGSESHKCFRDKYDLNFHLLSDPDGRVHDLYGAWRTTLLGRNALGVRRCTYIIDGDGIIRKSYKLVNSFTHASTVVKDLQQLNLS